MGRRTRLGRSVGVVRSLAISFAVTALMAAAVFLSWGIGIAPAAF
jgi:hypothetical protein